MLPKGLLREHAKTLTLLIRMMDMFIVFVTGYLAYWLKFNTWTVSFEYLNALLIAVVLAPVIFSYFSLYQPMRGLSLFNAFVRLIQTVCFFALSLAGLAFLTKMGENFSRVWFLCWMCGLSVLLITCRCAVLLFLRYMRSKGLNERRVIIIGTPELGEKLIENVQQVLWTGFRIVGLIHDQSPIQVHPIHGVAVMPMPTALDDYFKENKIDEVWIALPLQDSLRVKDILHQLRYQTMPTRFVLDVYGLNLFQHQITTLAGLPMINIYSTPMLGMNRLIKAVEDKLLAAFILILISPLLLCIACLIKLTSKGPIFYRQKRIGWNGREFEMLKFRTMPVNVENMTGPIWATADDKRPTKIGKWLRKSSLDELPQFINVLKGEMSIVGPRPERKVFVEEFIEKIPHYMQKHLVKAGITGWAQVNGWRGNTSLEKRIEYDLFYIENWSLKFDLKIIILTLIRGFINRNAY